MFHLIRSYLRKQDGASTLEFVLLFPAFMIILLSTIEAGYMMTQNVMLERGVNIAIRELRLGTSTATNEDELKVIICNEAAFISDCTNRVRIELTRVSTDDFTMPTGNVTCVQRDEDIQPAVTFESGTENDLMLMRACTVFDPLFPTTGLGLRLPKDSTGGYAIVSSAAFVVEPA